MPSQKDTVNNKPIKKRYNTRSSMAQLKKLKKNKDSDDSDSGGDDNTSVKSDSDSEDDAMDMHEYRKFISKIFPSKYMTNKIKKEGKMLENIKNDIEPESDLDEQTDEVTEANENVPTGNNSRQKNHSHKSSKPVTNKNKNKNTNKQLLGMIQKTKNSKKKRVIEEEEEEEDDGDESECIDDDDSESCEESEDDVIHVSGRRRQIRNAKKAFNIIFTIGDPDRNDNEDDSEYEDDSDYEDDSEYEDEEEDEEEYEEEYEEEDEEEGEEDGNSENRTDASKSRSSEEDRIKQQETLAEIRKTFEAILEKDATNKIAKEGLKDLELKEKKLTREHEKRMKTQKVKNVKKFKNLVNKKNLLNDYKFFKENLTVDEQQKVIKEVEEINKINIVQKPYRLTLLESDIPVHLKSIALNKIASLRYMEPGNGEYYKIKNWVDTFMQIPFNRYKHLPLTIDNGIEECHEYMAKSKQMLDDAVYGLNDAKLQIMQMIGQWIANPKAIGTAIAIKGPMGTGKTTLVKEGISKILNRDFAFIALGGATDSSFLEGHSYTYEGSTWGKIVDILVKTKTMNPVIYFDELDKISDTPKGEEIAGILTHLTDTTQNSQFHDKYFSEIDFDLSKCLFIFSYNDESKVNPILLDRMYKIQTMGYEKKDKRIISNDYLIPKIVEQVNFKKDDIIIPDTTIDYIVENYTQNESGVRNLKRCLEIIYTKLNLYRLMKPDSKLFENEMTLKVEFPFTVTTDILKKIIKQEDSASSYLFKTMYV